MMSSPSAPPTDLSATEGASGDRGEPRPIDLTRGGPPDELLDQMARADAINSRLRRSGREIAFVLSSDGCSLQIELRDETGHVLRRLSLSEAIDLAEGGPLPE
jgi:hypothetical protein